MSQRAFVKSGLMVAAVVAVAVMQSRGADPSSAELVKVLQSDAPKADKALVCKQLAVYGDASAVPALAALLADGELASWSRIALEVIPDPAADAALRDAVAKTQGLLRVGVINSIGVRRDSAAVAVLLPNLKDSDQEVAAAAAAALGRIGGDQAIAALGACLGSGPAALRSQAAEGLVLCAQRLLAEGKAELATQLYDTIRKAELPKQRILEATRGAILSRGAAGIPLLIETLHSSDKAIFGIGLRVARELQGGAVTDALVAELGKAPADRQALLLLALADRGDAKVLPVVVDAARSGAPVVRIAAAGVLERLGDVSCVPVLVEAASAEDPELAQTAKTSLARLRGKDVDADLLSRLQHSSGKARKVLIELAEGRKIQGAIAIFVASVQDPDAGVRSAALDAIGAIGDDKQVPQLLALLPKAQPSDRAAIEKAIIAISGRWGAASAAHLLPLAKSGDTATRITALHALAGCGGEQALAAISAAMSDSDGAIADEAVRTLSTWPNRWPDDGAIAEPLMNLAKSAKKPLHQVLALRGYLQYVQGTKRLPDAQRLAKVKEIMPLIGRAEEKRMAISALGAIGNAGALQSLVELSGDAAVADEACSAIVSVASKGNRGIPKPKRREALQMVIEKSKSPAIKAKAQETLKQVG